MTPINFLLEFIYQYVSFLPCVGLCYAPYTDRLKRGGRGIAILFAFICIPVAVLPPIFWLFGNDDTAPLVSLVFMLGSFFYYRKTVQDGLYKLLFTFLMVAHLVCLSTEIECAAVSLTGVLLLRGGQCGILGFSLCIILRLVIYSFIWRFINRFLTPRLRRINQEDMKGLWILPITFTAVSVYRLIMHPHDGTFDFVFPALTLFFAALSFFVYNLILKLIDGTMTRAKLEEEAKRNELLNQIKTEFLQDMSHEMKSPLTIIATGIDFANQEIHADDGSISEASEALEMIRAETQRLGRMIGGMAELASINEISENRKRINFAALLRDSAEAFRYALEQRNDGLTVQITPKMPDVFIEKDKFTRVIDNLLSNAADHTKDGWIKVAADFNDEYITARIADTGTGIPSDILPNVFVRGISGRGSTGYGLYICKTVVEAHGGTIDIESEPEKGTTVTFTVPVYGGQEAGHNL